MKPLVLGFGNELLTDDAIGILAARVLAEELADRADVIECGVSGLSLLGVLADRSQVVIIDAICTGSDAPGTIRELRPEDLRSTASPSPHYAGLPEVIEMARTLQLDFPRDIRIVAVKVADPHTIGGAMSEPVAQSLDEIVRRVKGHIDGWIVPAA
jgi:hydrogenase maturation protease